MRAGNVTSPRIAVYFWQGTSSEEWRLSRADITEVLAWARENAQGRRITIWVEAVDNGELGLIRLEGWEPVRTNLAPPWVQAEGKDPDNGMPP
jgi:hypothetical protein